VGQKNLERFFRGGLDIGPIHRLDQHVKRSLLRHAALGAEERIHGLEVIGNGDRHHNDYSTAGNVCATASEGNKQAAIKARFLINRTSCFSVSTRLRSSRAAGFLETMS